MKEKICMECGEVFPIRGRNAKYCLQCTDTVRKRNARERVAEYRIRHGLVEQPGVGSGGNQRGAKNHRYTTGIKAIFVVEGRRLKDTLNKCNRCGKDLLDATAHEWVCHHIDHDRANNTLDNFELLCKRCHQIEHECAKNLPN